MTTNITPRLAVVLGDPAGIGPELIARLLAHPGVTSAAQLLVIADREEFERGMDAADCKIDVDEISSLADLQFKAGKPVLYDAWKDKRQHFERCVATAAGG